MQKPRLSLALLTAACFSVSLVLVAQTRLIPLTPDAWDPNGIPVTFTTHLGVPAMRIGPARTDAGNPSVTVRDFVFRDGTVEYDFALDSSFFSELHFRRLDVDNGEHVYLRTFRADEPRANSAFQYSAIYKGVNYWDLSPEYQVPVEIKPEGWNHVKLVVKGRQLLAYVNDVDRPALYVPRLDTDIPAGALSLSGRGYYANVTYRPETPGLYGEEGRFAGGRDGRYLTSWRVSAPQTIDMDRMVSRVPVPEDTTGYRAIEAERFGLVNLSRPFGKTPDATKRVAFLTTTLESDAAREVEVALGFSDEVAVYVNGELAFVGETRFGTPQIAYPAGRVDVDNASFTLPLHEGENRIDVALANYFYGWGLKARLRETAGLSW